MPADSTPTLVLPIVGHGPLPDYTPDSGALTPEALTALRAAALDAIACTNDPDDYFGGRGPIVWPGSIDSAVGGRSGTYCAAAEPALILALIDAHLNHPTPPAGEPLGYVVVRKSRDAGTGRPHHDAVDLTWQTREERDRIHTVYSGIDSPNGETYLLGTIWPDTPA